MSNLTKTIEHFNWFYQQGPESDIILSSQIGLVRNIQGYPFPHQMSDEQKNAALELIISMIKKSDLASQFDFYAMNELTTEEKDLIVERNIASDALIQNLYSVIGIHKSKNLSLTLMDQDHLKISTIKGGLSLIDAYADCLYIDKSLEKLIQYAVSLKWGYQSSSLKDAGSGLQVSVLVHLPALEISSIIQDTLKIIMDKGLLVKCYRGQGNSTLASLYQISNKWSIGFNENSFLDGFRELLIPLISLERKIRNALIEKKESELRQKIERSREILKYSSSLSSQEAMELLSIIRLGVNMGFVEDHSLGQVTSLLFLSQKNQIRNYPSQKDNQSTKINNDLMRAKLIRDIL
ncbi:MAG: hypothetical protein JXR70_10030 [Spirochaetales bacterium]|nr:hypothetical protein [Spirochaetales bacterium]